jgi:tRNA-splicing ligase RtcB
LGLYEENPSRPGLEGFFVSARIVSRPRRREGRQREKENPMSGFEHIEGASSPIKAWISGVPLEHAAANQLRNVASLPFIHSHIAVMPDVHFGRGATVGSVIPTKGAIIPAAVGVDIGCGMMAVQTSLKAHQLPDSLAVVRREIERRVPVGNGPGGTSRTARPAPPPPCGPPG